MEEKRISPLKAIRLKCLDCSGGSFNEVKLCPVEKCPLYPFREGRNPFVQKQEWSADRRAAQKARFVQNVQSVTRTKSTNSPSEGTYIPQDIPG